MELALFSAPWFWALFMIIIMDLVLAGDNAIVIALAARNLPHDLQRKAIVWGTAGAIIIRVLMTLLVTVLLQIPFLKIIGGMGLIWIAIKLLKPHEDHISQNASESGHAHYVGFLAAIKTIVIADALMGLDNVLAIAGAAQGDFSLVIVGLLISVPIVVFGSTLVLKLIERHPWLIYLGAAVLAYTAVNMIRTDPIVLPYLADIPKLALYAMEAILIVVIVMGGRQLYSKKKPASEK